MKTFWTVALAAGISCAVPALAQDNAQQAQADIVHQVDALNWVHGPATVPVGDEASVRIPKGVKPGQAIRLAGQGSQGGDLFLEIEYAAHPQFEVDGRNVIHVLPVAPWEAALGATLSVPTLGGAVELKIPADSESGRKLRLRGRGLPGTGSAPAGDQIVELEVLAPKAHTDAQRKAYAKMRDVFGDDWRRG